MAKGKYIARMDADDVSMPERLEKEVKFLEIHQDYAVIGTFIKVLVGDSKIIFNLEKPIEDNEIKKFLSKDNCIAHGSAMIRKNHLLNIGLYNESIEKAQDYELWLQISKKYKLHNIPEYLHIWRSYKENMSIKHSNEQKHFVEFAKVRNRRTRMIKRKNIFNKPKFSVLMANYNNSKYIAEAIQSILNQTFKDWELAIIDDCSTDNSLDIIIPYLTDERIRLIKNKNNLGYIKTLKKLIYESRAEILGILDSDDALTNDALEVMYNNHEKNPDCGFIYSQFIYCDNKLNPEKKGYCNSVPPGKTNLHCNCVSAFRTFKKKEYFKTDGFDEEILYAEDKDIIFKMEEVAKLLFVDKILYKARVLANSQGHHPLKRQIAFVSFSLAKYKAYKRRLNTSIPNLTRNKMSTELFYAASLCTKQKELKKLKFFLLRAIKLDPLNFRGVKTYIRELLKAYK